MNRTNTAQWRNKKLIGSCTTLAGENALCTGYDKVPSGDVMIRSVARPRRNLAWSHRSSYPWMWHVVNAGNTHTQPGTRTASSCAGAEPSP